MIKLPTPPDRLRLEAEIDNYIQELRVRHPDLARRVATIRESLKDGRDPDAAGSGEAPAADQHEEILARLLAEARFKLIDKKDMETSWRSLNKAKQIEILTIKEAHALKALGLKFIQEASKLSYHRQQTVQNTLGYLQKDPPENPALDRLRSDVFMAAKIIGEHYDNEAFKVLMRTRSFRLFRLALILMLFAIPVAVAASHAIAHWGEPVGFKDIFAPGFRLYSIEAMGLLGGIFSVVLSFSKSDFKGTIPQQKLMFEITRLRPWVGAASALVLYILIKSGLLNHSLFDNAVYALAFISGFSERFVVNKLDSLLPEQEKAVAKPRAEGGK